MSKFAKFLDIFSGVGIVLFPVLMPLFLGIFWGGDFSRFERFGTDVVPTVAVVASGIWCALVAKVVYTLAMIKRNT